MQTLRFSKHHDVEIYEFGYAPIGRPVMTVYCYFVDGLLIDTAQANAERKVEATFVKKDIHQMALTHWHEDHTGNTATLANMHRPKIYAHPFTRQKVEESFKVLPYEQFMFGKIKALKNYPLWEDFPDEIRTAHYRFTPIYTPGHSEDHHVLLEKEQGWLFAGDLYVGIKIKFFRRGEDIARQIASMQHLLAFDFDIIFCGHAPQFKNAKRLMTAKLQYFEDFYGQAAHWHKQGFAPKQIIAKMGLKEAYLVKLLTFNDVSLAYMVESVIENEQKKVYEV